MDKYFRFIEASVKGSACNLKCNYCYVAQRYDPDMKDIGVFRYPPEIIGHALRKERIGGTAYVNICGEGETLLAAEIPEVIKHILQQGHYVNVYTNGTLSKRFDEILKIVPPEFLTRLSFAFSFHYLELKRLNKLEIYFRNFNLMKNAGCSVVANMVLDDAYLPHIEEIKRVSKENLGAYPQISFPKKHNDNSNWTALTKDVDTIKKIGAEFNSNYLDFTETYFDYNRKQFCYAGKWSFTLELTTGDIARCYNYRPHQNIFKDTDSRIKLFPIGNTCHCKACGGGLFLPQGVVPFLHAPSYIYVKDRPEAGWYTHTYKDFLGQQLIPNNREYGRFMRVMINLANPIFNLLGIIVAIQKRYSRYLRNGIYRKN